MPNLIEEALKREVDFFDKIKDDCNIIFDVGCREDIGYIELCSGKIFHMFEPNPESYKECKKKTDNIHNNIIYLNNFGLSNKTGEIYYWENFQSFFKREFKIDKEILKDKPVYLPVKKFSEYIEENNIKKIDFLKMDIEGGEPDILLDKPLFIKNSVKYVQFEYASTWIDRRDDKNLTDIITIYENYFNFYILYNKNHPISSKIPYYYLFQINDNKIIEQIEHYIRECFGFEIIMINKQEDTKNLL